METLKFKTTIKCAGCVAAATPFLNEAVGEGRWKVDVEDPAKILRIEGEKDSTKVISAVEKAGFKAENLA